MNLKKVESGSWKKVYKDGYLNGKKSQFIILKVLQEKYLM